MIRSRHLLLAMVAMFATSSLALQSVDAQLFRWNRNNNCCPNYSTPMYSTPSSSTYMSPSYSTPVYSAPAYTTPVYSTPATNYSMPVQATPVYSAPVMNYSNNCGCNGGIVYSDMGQPVVNNWNNGTTEWNPVVDPNNGGDVENRNDNKGTQDEIPQSCLDMFTTCINNCAACTGSDLTACNNYCGCLRRNCPKAPHLRENCPTPPTCYTGPSPPIYPGQGGGGF